MGITRLTEYNDQVNGITGTVSSDIIDLDTADTYSIQSNIVVDAPSNKTFDDGVDASKVIQDLTYTAKTPGLAGNNISIAYVAPSSGTHALSVLATGSNIVVNLESTAEATATATLDLTNDIILTSVASGAARNTNTFTTQVIVAAANPTDTVLADFTGTAAAIVLTITPNDGSNNNGMEAVDLTTAEIVELINTGAVTGKNVTVTDTGSLRTLQTATGGGSAIVVDSGQGDGVVATFSGGATFNNAISTATEIKAIIDGDVPSAALVAVSISGTGSTVQTPVSPTNLTGGTDGEINTVSNSVLIPAHGYPTGLKVRLTTTGTLPTGLTTGVDYFIIKVDANNVKFASSLANALLGTAIDITDVGSTAGVATVVVTALAGASVKLQKSNDAVIWFDESSATNITVSTSVLYEKVDPTYRYAKLLYTLTAGALNTDNHILVKGF